MAFHGKAHGHEAEAEWQFLPSRESITKNLQTVHDILHRNAHRVMSVGIEVSHAHIPSKLHRWLDCAVSLSLYKALQIKTVDTVQFARFQTAPGDERVPSACQQMNAKRLWKLFDREEIDDFEQGYLDAAQENVDRYYREEYPDQ